MSKTETPTPRTDAAAFNSRTGGVGDLEVVAALFARTLERELTQARAAAIEECAKVCDDIANNKSNGAVAKVQAKRCARNIRALAQPAKETGG